MGTWLSLEPIACMRFEIRVRLTGHSLHPMLDFVHQRAAMGSFPTPCLGSAKFVPGTASAAGVGQIAKFVSHLGGARCIL
mmetsp:Transcript_82198/g.208874  ORF Transcript_82198/g.208874 Transcript_82198/m.208874 type:complete len:80 (-) Transcript_82198:387-626(-)